MSLPAMAVELTFDQSQPVTDGEPVNQAYGDRVAFTQEGNFRYRGNRGLTPHISAAYGPVTASPAVWTTGYGDLTNDETATALEITLAGDPGQARLGFISKYQKGTTVPTGRTQFEFKMADLDFVSTEYEWLIVSGHRAQFKGTGQINGSGNYGFLLTAKDENLSPSFHLDEFRIKIWDKDDNDTVVYDNRMGEDETSDAATPISKGSIVINSN